MYECSRKLQSYLMRMRRRRAPRSVVLVVRGGRGGARRVAGLRRAGLGARRARARQPAAPLRAASRRAGCALAACRAHASRASGSSCRRVPSMVGCRSVNIIYFILRNHRCFPKKTFKLLIRLDKININETLNEKIIKLNKKLTDLTSSCDKWYKSSKSLYVI